MSPRTDVTLEGPVRVRFAPSPTGFLHVGGARTAIYNELLRRSVGGAHVLRIEDTDRERSDEAMVRQIQAGLAWVGVEWDEGPVLQSAGVERHRRTAAELLEAGKAYRCFCTQEELAEARRAAEAKGERFRYDRRCLGVPAEEAAAREAAGDPHVVRLRMPDEPIVVHDLVRGRVEFPPEMLDDFVLLRSDGSPTYHLSVVADDIDMRITHVIRGDDHLSNTPKHAALFRALGAPEPTFAHLPLILGPDRKRLSKRTGSTSVEEFRDQGILPQALYNYLALLGWSPGDDRELMTKDEMIELFTVDRLNASAAIFDHDKLAWMNAQYLSGLPLEEVRPHLQPFLDRAGLGELEGERADRLERAIAVHRGRAKNLVELAESIRFYFADELDYDPELCGRFLGDAELPGHLTTLAERYRGLAVYEVEPLDATLRDLAAELGVKPAVLIHPLRMAVSGTKAGPGVFDVVAVAGRDLTDRRLAHFHAFLERHPHTPAAS